MIDGTIDNAIASWGYILVFAVGANWFGLRENPRPPIERYRKDGGVPWVAFWNLFDESQFTPEAIEFHRRAIRMTVGLAAMFILGWFLLDWLW